MKAEILQNLSKLVAIPSVSSDREKVGEALNFVLDLASSFGLKAYSCLDGQVGIVEMGEGEETLGMLTHVDVVPPDPLEEWETDPFQAVIKDDRIYGRGTLDDKGMIIACLYAMKAVHDQGIPLKKKVQLIIGTQEETEWTDMENYIRTYPLPDYGFTPDGEYPICNIEKGIITCEIAFQVAESVPPSDKPYIKAIKAGTAENSVPARATAVLSDGREITATGKTVHACQPEKGENAIFNLCRQLESMNLAETKTRKVLRCITEWFQDGCGKAIDLYNESEYYQGEFVHRNTFAPTILDADEEKAVLTLDIRYAYGTSPVHIREKLSTISMWICGKLLRFEDFPAVYVSKDRPFLKVFADAYEQVTGTPNEFTLAYGGSYAKAMPGIVSWGPIFPGEEDTCHEPNEYICIDSLVKSTEIFTIVIAEIASTEQSLK